MTRPAIIVAHGQPSDPEPQQQAVEALAAALNGESRELVIEDDALWVGDISVPVHD